MAIFGGHYSASHSFLPCLSLCLYIHVLGGLALWVYFCE